MLYVLKRNGNKENVHFDKITERINKLVNMNLEYIDSSNDKYIDSVLIAQKVVASIYSGITTEELDLESAEICVNLSTIHPIYSHLGGRILISNLHKKTLNNFVDKMILLSKETNIIDEKWLLWVINNADELNQIIDYNKDYIFDYFGFKTLEKSYLLKINNKIIERPQDMLLRTAITLQMNNMDMIKKTYEYLSLGYYIHASPTLFNSGTTHMQLASCYLLGTNDNLNDISTTWNSCAQISKWSGGIGLHVSNIRSKNSLIKGTNGKSNGLVPFLKVFNEIARWIDQGGKRPGSIAIYLEPHHSDIFEFLELRKNFGSETERARDLFFALWISDLFMECVLNDTDWYLLSADECPNLNEVYGKEYEELYWKYVYENKYRSKIKARDLWSAILTSQIETGMPYISYKDTINKTSNQKNLGTIKSSNLCNEIVEYSDHNEYAVCNLASISLKTFIKPFNNNNNKWKLYLGTDDSEYIKKYLDNYNIKYNEIITDEKYTKVIITNNYNIIELNGFGEVYKHICGEFDFDKLYDVAYLATINLNQVIDINFYPVEQTKYSNMRHRPIGLGIQGLADTLSLLKIEFDSEDSLYFNKKIMEIIYLASMNASNELAMNRTNSMKMLITYINENNITYPDYYSSEYILQDNFINNLYHNLKPNKWELNRDPLLTTIGAYSSFDNSPFSKGIFQFDFYDNKLLYKDFWNELKIKVKKYGTRNSLLTALMPTASTSQILGNTECFEYFTNNIYTRKTQAGNFILVNKYLVNDLIKLDLWNENIKNKMIASDGSIQSLNIPQNIKNQYKTIWEIKQIWTLKNASVRQPFVDQSQSMNIFMAEPDFNKLHSSHFKSWNMKLKTGMYYLRTKPASEAIKFTIDPNLENEICSRDNPNCLSCSG
jgi:ribonucleoside-diphosphate reductase alpha subunit